MTVRIYEVAPRLLQSARTPAMTDGEIRALIERGVTMVVNLWHTPDERLIGQVGVYHHCSVPDGRLGDLVLSRARTAADMAATEIARGGTVLVHCYGGRNRAGLVSALVLMRTEGLSGAEALARVRAARPNSLVNRHFAGWLADQPQLGERKS